MENVGIMASIIIRKKILIQPSEENSTVSSRSPDVYGNPNLLLYAEIKDSKINFKIVDLVSRSF